jgi:hypothetical protein
LTFALAFLLNHLKSIFFIGYLKIMIFLPYMQEFPAYYYVLEARNGT